jgi:hypothetical protein
MRRNTDEFLDVQYSKTRSLKSSGNEDESERRDIILGLETRRSLDMMKCRHHAHLCSLHYTRLHVVGGLLQVVVVVAAHLLGGQEGRALPEQRSHFSIDCLTRLRWIV